MTQLLRKKILTVTLHFDDSHSAVKRPYKVPQGMGAVFLAGAFSPDVCDIKVYSELFSGPLEDEGLLGWADMIVMTGVTNCFDRMLHISAYARSKNSRVIIVAGGPPVRALPRYSTLFFDYSCTGDIEQLKEVIAEAFGAPYVAEEMIPRLDLAHWIGIHGHVETSRYCNFSCRFCALTGENTSYKKYDLGYIERQFELMGRRRTVHFIDNNFYGNDRDFFLARLDLINHYRRRNHFKYWSALVTGDFFADDNNLRLAAESGCCALFSGVESFSTRALQRYDKRQNTLVPQETLIRKTMQQGIAFWYGLFVDVYERPVEEIHEELDCIVSNPRITLPGFITLPIPLIGTGYFHDCLSQNKFIPGIRLRHLDGTTLCMKPLSPLDDVVRLVGNLERLVGYRRKILRHGVGMWSAYRRSMKKEILFYALASNVLLTCNTLFTGGRIFSRGSTGKRTYIATTEQLERTYTPAFQVHGRYLHYFEPTMLTDSRGNINEDLAEDIFAGKHTSRFTLPA